jgi:hypothetical protein
MILSLFSSGVENFLVVAKGRLSLGVPVLVLDPRLKQRME